MKKYLAGLVTGIILATATISFAANPIKLVVNGKEVKSDVPPQVINGRTLVPARPLAEALGAKVEWDDANRSVVITGEGYQKLNVDASSVWQGGPIMLNKSLEVTIENVGYVDSFKPEYISAKDGVITPGDGGRLLILTYTAVNQSDKYVDIRDITTNAFKLMPDKDDGRKWYFNQNDIDYKKLSDNRYLMSGDTIKGSLIAYIPTDVSLNKITIPKYMVGLPKDLQVNIPNAEKTQ